MKSYSGEILVGGSMSCNLDCMGEAEGWKGEEEAAILRLQIQELDSKEQITFAPRYFKESSLQTT